MKLYVCPMHPEVKQDKPGRCSKCGMKLVLQDEAKHNSSHHVSDKGLGKLTWKNYMPLILIIGFIFFSSLLASYPTFNIKTIISTFMAGFFIIFSIFKLIDLKGFAQGYSTYDLLAKRFYYYGYIYPFIELFLGFAMIFKFYETQIIIAEILIMAFSGLGVLQKLMKGEKFQCVCLGTFLKVPLTKVTLIEDFGMAFLGIVLLLLK